MPSIFLLENVVGVSPECNVKLAGRRGEGEGAQLAFKDGFYFGHKMVITSKNKSYFVSVSFSIQPICRIVFARCRVISENLYSNISAPNSVLLLFINCL